ncbi:capsular biosynthesis protein [Burkholderia multivorans]|uniref:capsular polysaccharide biosynthesis protein n=1 Tax=Burkholderia multivorans TaxID=87883 RepID=UPI00201847EF|nr:capsular biosynthesis protein [Burkholderia multivorans]MCO1456793.1 capsular biosynthesis protein [Burkholderia multivorans]UQO16507.1 capsular biosynthesis protein [Burkholderia multivorans]
MPRVAIKSSQTPAIPGFDVRAISRGHRLIGWLTGHSHFAWIEGRASAICARIAAAAGFPVQPVCTGPIFAGRTRHAPPFSWFRIPIGLTAHDGLPAAIEKTLDEMRDSKGDARTYSLMQRILATNALHPQRHIVDLPIAWHSSGDAGRVVIVDERDASRTDVCTPRRNRLSAFATMIEAASSNHPGARLWILRSADEGAGRWLSARTNLPPNVRFLGTGLPLAQMLKQTTAIYTVGSSEGMAALLAGVPVYTFGTPYYAGWGLTVDHARMPDRTARPTLAAFFNTTFLQLATYLDPRSRTIGTLDTVLDSIELQHSIATRYGDLNRIACVGFQWWKRKYATPYLSAGGGRLRWVRDTSNVRLNECAAIWGGRSTAGLADGIHHIRIEDGFLHSVGLGSDMSPPQSQVVDRSGIYFDASRPNDLTAILNRAEFEDAELSRAAALRQEIVRFGLTKYNLGRRAPTWRALPGRRIALVAGQVADDASIRLGTGAIATSEDLLREVRRQRPEAFIVYKPHPDVLSGNRAGLVDAERLADIVDSTADLVSLIEACDEVHTLSSLAGFDALMRGKPVFTYGLPFYAGWGLTHDLLPQPWRERSLSIDMLTAGVLLRYPLYWDWQLSIFTTPEAVIQQLAETAARPLDRINGNRRRAFIKGWRWSRNALNHVISQIKYLTTENNADTHRMSK